MGPMIKPNPGTTVCSAFLAAEERFSARPFLRAPANTMRTQSGEAPAGNFTSHARDNAHELSGGTAIEFTYASARREAERLNAGYQSLGVRSGQRVALAFDSRLDVYLHLLALNALGASIVPLNMAGSDNEILYVLGHSDARLITGAAEHLERLRVLAGKGKSIPVATVPTTIETHGLTRPAGEADTEVALLYTSGTTGKPKGCMLSNDYFLTMGREYNRLGKLCTIDSTDRLMTPLPPAGPLSSRVLVANAA
jgi:long-subunit acyl-CoA synthetase (AMP-forming)